MACKINDDCPFLFHCDQNFECQHNSVFPLNFYTIFVYILIPLACGLVNTTGNSMGIFKVLIVMNLLRYESQQATMITQSLVVGTALPNFFSILGRKHPKLETSLVNFNLVYILIPCCLLGSTLGSLVGEFIPLLFQDMLIVLVFSYFATKFYKKFKQLQQKHKQNIKQPLLKTSQETVDQTIITEDSIVDQSTGQQFYEQNQNIVQNQSQNHHEIQYNTNQKQNISHKTQIIQYKEEEQWAVGQITEQQKNILVAYQKSIHFKDIIMSFLTFLIFQFMVFLVQGKFPFLTFSHCSWTYYTGIVLLIIITLIYLNYIRQYLTKRFQTYDAAGIQQEIHLNKNKQFRIIALGGLAAGIVQGILGLGSGTCIMSVLLSTPLNAASASATSGYQVLFIGLAALVEGFINGEVNVIDTTFFIIHCTLFGGAVTLGITHYLKKKNQDKVSKILVFIILVLCLISIIMVVPSGVFTYKQFGWHHMMRIKFSC